MRGQSDNSKEKIIVISIVLIGISFVLGVALSTPIYDVIELEPEKTTLKSDYYNGETNYIQRNSHPIDFDMNWNNSNITIEDVDTWSQSYGKSMQPTMWSGHTLLMREVNPEKVSLREGMILRYESEDGGGVVHRLTGNYDRTSGELLMRGDNNQGSEVINTTQVTHKVIGVLYTED